MTPKATVLLSVVSAVALAAGPVMAKTHHPVPAPRTEVTQVPANVYDLAGSPLIEPGNGVRRGTPDWGYFGGQSYGDAARLDRQMNRGF